MSDTPLGRPCWYECLTTDPAATQNFYPAITGWTTAEWEGAMPYTMWMLGQVPLGGVMTLPEAAAAMGAPPHWLVYFSTPDLDRTTEKARSLGADVLQELEVPEVGRIGVMRDPGGAVFAAFQPAGDTPGSDEAPGVGRVSWHELMTTDGEVAWSFYSSLFGWTEDSQMDMGDMGVYRMFGRGAHPLGGMMTRPPEVPASAWMIYVRVPDVDAATAKVKELGGQVLNGPMEVPGGDRVAQCMDPQDAAFGLHQAAGG